MADPLPVAPGLEASITDWQEYLNQLEALPDDTPNKRALIVHAQNAMRFLRRQLQRR